MDLELDITALSTPGRRPVALDATVIRDLRPADFILLTENRSTQPAELKRVTERHHAIARLLASGMKSGEVAATLGITLNRISILKNSPAFAELLALYVDTKDLEFAEVASRMAGVSKDALNLIQDRLEDDPDTFTHKELREVATAFADRTGHGPTAKSVAVSINATMGDRLEAARNRAKAAALGTTIDITPEVAE